MKKISTYYNNNNNQPLQYEAHNDFPIMTAIFLCVGERKIVCDKLRQISITTFFCEYHFPFH